MVAKSMRRCESQFFAYINDWIDRGIMPEPVDDLVKRVNELNKR